MEERKISQADWIFSCPCLVWLMCKPLCLESFVGVESGGRGLRCNPGCKRVGAVGENGNVAGGRVRMVGEQSPRSLA